MTTTRRDFVRGGAMAAAAVALGSPTAHAQGKELNVVGATFNLRDPILQEFTKRTGVTVKPWLNPSAQARADRLRVQVPALFQGVQVFERPERPAYALGLDEPVLSHVRRRLRAAVLDGGLARPAHHLTE